jgi:hypothetical protein
MHHEQNRNKVSQHQYQNYFVRIVQVHDENIVVDPFDFEQRLGRTPRDEYIYIFTQRVTYSYQTILMRAC